MLIMDGYKLSFSFELVQQTRIQFEPFCVLNDDVIGEGMGFGTHLTTTWKSYNR
jgi:hypothetical protein